MPKEHATFYFALCIVVQLTVLTFSSLNGNLAGLVPWDDCVYLSRATHNIEKVLAVGSLKDLLLIRPRLEIHAPVADFQSLFGMLLSQGSWSGVYFLNFLFVWSGMVIVDWFFSHYRPLIRLPIVICFLLVPFVFVVFDLIKSDYKGGLFFFCCLLLLFRKDNGNRNEVMEAAAIGLLGSLAILSKLTAFYFPAILVIAVVLAATVRWTGHGIIGLGRRGDTPWLQVVDGRRLRRELVLGAAMLGLILVPPLIVWYFWYSNLVGYINFALSSVWDDHLTLSTHLLYYTPLNPGNRIWGSIFWVSMGVSLSAILWSWKSRKWIDLARVAALAVIVVLTTIPLLAAHTHNVTFGAYFYFSCLAMAFCAIDIILTAITERWRTVLAAVLFLIGAGQPLALGTSSLSREELRANYRAFALITEDIHEIRGHFDAASRIGPRGAVLYECYLMCYFNLTLLYYKSYGSTLPLERFDDYGQQTQSLSEMLDRSDFVLAIDSNDAKGLQKSLFTASAKAKELDQLMQQDRRFVLKRSLPVMNFNLHLFVKQQAIAASGTAP